MNKKLALAMLCVFASGSSIVAHETLDKIGRNIKWGLDAPAGIVFGDGSWLATKTHRNVPFVSRLALTLYVVGGTAALSPKALKKRLAKIAFWSKKK